MGIPNYPNIKEYVWPYKNRYEIHVDSYMCNQDIKVMYLGFFYNNTKIKAVYK